jgi:hypothetical protein
MWFCFDSEKATVDQNGKKEEKKDLLFIFQFVKTKTN